MRPTNQLTLLISVLMTVQITTSTPFPVVITVPPYSTPVVCTRMDPPVPFDCRQWRTHHLPNTMSPQRYPSLSSNWLHLPRIWTLRQTRFECPLEPFAQSSDVSGDEGQRIHLRLFRHRGSTH